MAQTNQTRQKFWTDWTHFLRNFFHIQNPYLPQFPHNETLTLVQTFASWVRTGNAGRKDQVGSKRVQQALAAIAKTFQLAGKPSPTYQDQGRQLYWPALQQQLESFKREDPPPQQKLAVPITVPHYLVLLGLNHPSPHRQAINDLICIAFYYLLRVGEYTYTPPKHRKRTQRFRIKDIIFRRRDHSIIPNTAPLNELYTAAYATLQISNQKNGSRGQCIHNECTGHITSPVRALARRVANIMAFTNNQNTAISTYYNPVTKQSSQLYPSHVSKTIKQTILDLGLHQFGFTEQTVSSHSLRAGGAMAMKLNGMDDIIIKKHGRWSSDTFLTYIHTQIGALTAGVSKAMLQYIPFCNVNSNGPTLHGPSIT